MRAGRTGILAAVILGTLGLVGCGKDIEKTWNPDRTALILRKDGTVRETVIDELDRGYYDQSELEEMIRAAVAEYNADNGENAIVVTTLDHGEQAGQTEQTEHTEQNAKEDETIRLILEYRSAQDYQAFNNVTFYNGSMLGAQMEGFLFYNDFRTVVKGVSSEELISNEEPMSHKEYQVLVMDATHEVLVPGDIVYVSANAAVSEKRIACPLGEKEEKQAALVLPSSAIYLPEKEEKDLSALELEQTYIYVIYKY